MTPINYIEAREAISKLQTKVELTPRVGALFYCGIDPPENCENFPPDFWHSLGLMSDEIRYANDIVLTWKSQSQPPETNPQEFILWINNYVDENWPKNPIGARPPLLDISGRVIALPLKQKQFRSTRQIFTPPVEVQTNFARDGKFCEDKKFHPGDTLDRRRKEVIKEALKNQKKFSSKSEILDHAWIMLLASIEENPPRDVERINPIKNGSPEIKRKWGEKSVNKETLRSEFRKHPLYEKLKEAIKKSPSSPADA